MVAVAVAMATYDLVSTLQSLWAFVILAALGVAAFEATPRRVRARRRWGYRAVLPLVGFGVGCLLFVLAPLTSSQTFSVLLTAPWVSYYSPEPVDVYDGTALSNTLCGAVTNPDVVVPGTTVRCLQTDVVQPFAFPPEAQVTVRAATPKAVAAEVRRAFLPIYRHQQLTGAPEESVQTGRPAWAVTAPFWCAAAGLLAMALVPPLPVRRRPRRRGVHDKADEDVGDTPQTLERQSVRM
jgi:hypothetical protein